MIGRIGGGGGGGGGGGWGWGRGCAVRFVKPIPKTKSGYFSYSDAKSEERFQCRKMQNGIQFEKRKLKLKQFYPLASYIPTQLM